MKQKNKNKDSVLWIFLTTVLAMLLIVSILVGATAKTKKVYIAAPPEASDDFAGEMLSDYDNVTLKLANNKILFDFIDVNLRDYDFVVLDVCNSNFHPYDTTTFNFRPDCENIDLNTQIRVDNMDYSTSISGVFNEFSGTFTYLFDMRNENIVVYLYHNGSFSKSFDTNLNDSILSSFVLEPDSTEKIYAGQSIGAMYLYGFEDADDCTIGDYISDITLKLTDCKDSMLYTGE